MFLCFVDFVDPRYSKPSYAAVEALKEVAPSILTSLDSSM
jgi:hypothetical protein